VPPEPDQEPPDPGLLGERQAALALLRSAYVGVPAQEVAEKLTVLARAYSGCEAVAVRLRSGPDYPYAASLGFDPEFIRLEDRLCARDAQGQIRRDGRLNPLLECMCGTVLSCRQDPAPPYFTPCGSFLAQSTSDLLQSASEEEREALRGRCHTAGYESVGLFPIRLGDNTFGLIQCNDRRRGRFTPERTALIEDLAATAAHLFQLAML